MFCGQVKEYLSQKEVPFTERDITQNEAYLDELRILGFMTTPVLKIDGEVIVGFDRERIDQALGGK